MLHMIKQRYFPVRITADGYAALKRLADAETDGNVSEMARRLLGEALTARAAKNRH